MSVEMWYHGTVSLDDGIQGRMLTSCQGEVMIRSQ